MRSPSIFPFIMTMISNFVMFTYLSNVYFQIFLCKYNRFLHFFYDYCCSFVNGIFFLKLVIFIACFLKDSQNLFQTIFASAYMMLVCYAFKWWNCRHWKTRWNVLLCKNFQDYFYLHESFLINIQDLRK